MNIDWLVKAMKRHGIGKSGAVVYCPTPEDRQSLASILEEYGVTPGFPMLDGRNWGDYKWMYISDNMKLHGYGTTPFGVQVIDISEIIPDRELEIDSTLMDELLQIIQ